MIIILDFRDKGPYIKRRFWFSTYLAMCWILDRSGAGFFDPPLLLVNALTEEEKYRNKVTTAKIAHSIRTIVQIHRC